MEYNEIWDENTIKIGRVQRYLMEKFHFGHYIQKNAVTEVCVIFDDKNDYGMMRVRTTDDATLKAWKEWQDAEFH